MDDNAVVSKGQITSTTPPFKIPPHSLEAEQAVLGGVMLDVYAWDKIADRLTEKDFYRREHRVIFRKMAELTSLETPLDVITVSEALEKQNLLEDIGGLSYLANLAKNTPSAANIAAYADIVHEHAILRSLIEASGEITEASFAPKGRVAREILDEAEQKIFAIAERGAKKNSGARIISEVLTRTVERVQTLFESKSPITGLSTGFKDLDKLTAGLQPSDLIIIAGRPSMGKTMLAMNIAEFVAMTSEKPVLVFSMEMPAESLAMRVLSSLGRIEQHKLRTGQLLENEWPRITSAISMISSKQLLIDDTGGLSPTEVRARARRVAKEYNGIGLIVIDYLQLMRGSGNSEHRAAEISEISRSLKVLARELNVPIIALSQLNRSLEQRPDKRPMMSDLRESGAIEQDADVIMFIYRDEFYHKDSADKGLAEIIISKQRNGPIGTVRMTYLGHYAKFENFAPTAQQMGPGRE